MITGAGRGLGRKLAQRFSLAGDRLILNCRNTILNPAPNDSVVYGDLLNDKTIDDLVCEARDGIDILINCAGVYDRHELNELKREQLEAIMGINFFAPVNLVRRLWPVFCLSKMACIVNINSLAGEVGAEKEMAYAASKHALRGFFDSLKFEATKYNIRIINLYPGAMKTDMTKHRSDWNKLIDPCEVADTVFNACNYQSMNINKMTICRSQY